jgi:signal transduction histidine kinase
VSPIGGKHGGGPAADDERPGTVRAFARSVRGRLALLIAAWLLPLAVLAALGLVSAYDARMEAERNASVELARAVAGSFRNVVQDVFRHELAMGEAIASGTLPEREVRRLLEASAEEYAPVRDFSWASPQGTITASSDPRLVGETVANASWIERLHAGEERVLSGLLREGPGGGTAFVIARGVREGARLRGVLFATVDPDRLPDVAFPFERVGDAAVALVDPAGRVVFRIPEVTLRWEERTPYGPEPLLARALRGEEAAGTFQAIDGGDRIGAAVPVLGLGWAVRATRSRAEVAAPILRDLRGGMALAIAVTLAALAASLAIGGRIARSLGALERHARALGRGERDPVHVRGAGEVERVAAAVDDMAARLLSANASLAAAVREADEQRRRSEFLLRAGGILSESLQLEEVADRLARVIVPAFADWCAIDEVGRGRSVRLLALAHANPACEVAIREQRLRWPPSGRHSLAWRAISGRRTIHVPEVTRDTLAEIARDHEHLAALVSRGFRSWIVVPLVAREEVYGAVSIATVEEGRALEAQDVRTAEDLARRAAQAMDNARLYREAQHAIRNRDDVIGVVSHDLRTPLGAIMLGARAQLGALASGRAEPPALGRALERIVSAGERMDRLIGDLLDLARLQEGRLAVERAEHDPRELAREAVEQLRPLADEKGLELSLAEGDGAPPVSCDRDRVLQVLGNLVGNAIKATEAGFVRVGVVPRENAVEFQVADSGPGIAEEELPQMFERYRRASSAPYAGTGLGLAIARGLVAAHGGRIWAESRVGEGSRFCFTLPLARPGTQISAREARPDAGATRPGGSSRWSR